MHLASPCSLCGIEVLHPEWRPLGILYPPQRWYQALHRDEHENCWIVRCHGCQLHHRLLQIDEELQTATERAETFRAAALATWEREQRRQFALQESQDTNEEWVNAQTYAARRVVSELDEYQRRINAGFPRLPDQAGTVRAAVAANAAPAGPDASQALQQGPAPPTQPPAPYQDPWSREAWEQALLASPPSQP